MARVASPKKAAEWAERLGRFEASELTVVRFCKAERVSPASLYLWRKRLAKRQAASVPRAARHAFRPVEVVPSAASRDEPQARIRLPGGIAIELGGDVQLASQVIESLVKSALAASGGDA